MRSRCTAEVPIDEGTGPWGGDREVEGVRVMLAVPEAIQRVEGLWVRNASTPSPPTSSDRLPPGCPPLVGVADDRSA
jgi:hypothetical protein